MQYRNASGAPSANVGVETAAVFDACARSRKPMMDASA
jgi:hypothetical protein